MPAASSAASLFGRAAEDRRVAPLEPRDDLPGPRRGDHPLVNFLLADQPAVAVPAQALQFGAGASVLEDPGVDQVVVQHHVGLAEPLPPAQREQPRIARAGADEIRFSREL